METWSVEEAKYANREDARVTREMIVTSWMCVKYLTVIMFVIVDSMEFTLANEQCKSIVMNVVMKQCSDPGMRSRRDIRDVTLDIKPTDVNPEDNYAAKEVIPELVAPNENWKNPEIPRVTTGRLARRDQRSATGQRRERAAQYSMAVSIPSLDDYPYFVSQTVSPMKFYRPENSRFSRGILPEVYGDNLGFDLTTDEMDELSNEYFVRFLRHSQKNPEEAKRLFLETAARCCKNEEMCMREKNIISCV